MENYNFTLCSVLHGLLLFCIIENFLSVNTISTYWRLEVELTFTIHIDIKWNLKILLEFILWAQYSYLNLFYCMMWSFALYCQSFLFLMLALFVLELKHNLNLFFVMIKYLWYQMIRKYVQNMIIACLSCIYIS